MRRVVIISLTVFLFASLATAQVPTAGNVFFGYSFQNASSSAFGLSNVSRPNMNGWRGSLEGRVFPWVGIVADFNGEYGSHSFTTVPVEGPTTGDIKGHEHDVLFGPRVSVPVGKLRPFGEFLAGVSHINVESLSHTCFATALGGGLDYRLARIVAWRFQGDYVHTRFFGTRQDNARLSTGIVLRF